MLRLRVIRALNKSAYVLLEVLRGHIKDISKELLYFINLQLIYKVDIGYVTNEALGLPKERNNSFCNSGGPALEKILKELEITPNNAVIDIGSGKGGALLTFAKYPFHKIAGIELSHNLIEIAYDNFNKFKIQKK